MLGFGLGMRMVNEARNGRFVLRYQPYIKERKILRRVDRMPFEVFESFDRRKSFVSVGSNADI